MSTASSSACMTPSSQTLTRRCSLEGKPADILRPAGAIYDTAVTLLCVSRHASPLSIYPVTVRGLPLFAPAPACHSLVKARCRRLAYGLHKSRADGVDSINLSAL